MGFKSLMNQHITECRDGISSCTFPGHIFHCGTKTVILQNNFLKLLLWYYAFWNPQKLEFCVKYLQQKGYDTLKIKAHFSKNVSL